jgi:hypothetical protein
MATLQGYLQRHEQRLEALQGAQDKLDTLKQELAPFVRL